MSKLGSLWVVRGHPRSLNTAPFDRVHMNSYQPSIVTILHRFWDVARYWSKIANLNLPHLYLAHPLGMISLEFRWDFWHQKTRVPGLLYGIVRAIIGLAIFVELQLVTDRQTHNDSIYHTSVA